MGDERNVDRILVGKYLERVKGEKLMVWLRIMSSDSL